MCHDLDPRSYLQGQGHSAHIPKNPCPGYISSLPCWIWIIFHTIVVHDPRVCHDLDPRSYLQSQGHSAHIPKICIWAITLYCQVEWGWRGMTKLSMTRFVAAGGICPIRTCLVDLDVNWKGIISGVCMPYVKVFLAHLSRRLKWAIVIAHRPSSVRPSVRPSVRRPSGVNFHIFDFFSETAERNSTKLYRKQDLNALYQVCVFRADPKNKMAALASDWLRHFLLLLWNRWTEFNKTWQEARSQCPLPSLCFSGRSEKQDGRPGLWLAETFSTSPLKPLNWIQQNLIGGKISKPSTKFVFFGPIGKTRWPPPSSDWLRHFRLLCRNRWTEFKESWQEARSQRPLPSFVFFGPIGKTRWPPGLWLAEIFSTSSLKPLNGIQPNLTGIKILTPSTKFVLFGPIWKTRWPPWPLIGRDIFDFFSETAERNSIKFDVKQDLNALYQILIFWADRKTRWPPWPLIGWDIFDFSSETAERNSKKLDRKQDLNALYQVCVFRADRKTRWPPWPLIGWDIFELSSETAERNSKKLDRKQDLNALYQVCVFRADRKNKMAALASDWLRHFRLLIWNRWTEFKECWQEARSQRPLPSFVFFGPIGKTRWLPGLWLAEIFSTSSLKPLNGIQRNLIGSKIATPSTKFVFFGWIRKTKWPPWPMIGWDIFDFSYETTEWNSAKLDRKQDLNVLYQVCVFWAKIGHGGPHLKKIVF